MATLINRNGTTRFWSLKLTKIKYEEFSVRRVLNTQEEGLFLNVYINSFHAIHVVSYLDGLKHITVLIGNLLDFRFEILILLDSMDAWWLFLDFQVIGLGEKAIFSDL